MHKLRTRLSLSVRKEALSVVIAFSHCTVLALNLDTSSRSSSFPFTHMSSSSLFDHSLLPHAEDPSIAAMRSGRDKPEEVPYIITLLQLH